METYWPMAVSCIVIPLIMVIFGAIMIKKTPKRNMLFGYRTRRSTASDAAWDYAQKLAGRIFLRLGLLLLAATALVFALIYGKSEKTIITAGTVLLYGGIGLLVLSIIPVEIMLNKKFDKDGNERE